MNAWRGTALIIKKSPMRVGAVTLRHPLTRVTLHSHNSRASAIGYCRRNGFSWMDEVTDVDQTRLEARF
jgi:hypothetical protein